MQQTVYIAKRFIRERNGLILGLIKISATLKLNGYFIAIDAEKTFNSLDQHFKIATLETFQLNPTFFIGSCFS